jgi:hypothetical protein
MGDLFRGKPVFVEHTVGHRCERHHFSARYVLDAHATHTALTA